MVKERGEGYSGADFAAVVREAGVAALRRTLGALDQMEADGLATAGEEPKGVPDFERALEKAQPSFSTAQRRKYASLRVKLSGSGLPVGVTTDEGKEGKGGGMHES
ncbi:uncharacterized protein C8Q71DRAFT_848884 [Rhodofomes roseus]|nr:uncharacterized protein C8Q71DRAFT_848884 [Rhodofomes roseus]KAH9835169.1 hypothetical protein C8Q71DRAFT_848884 [Rhodofomes roseus]